MKLQKLIKKYPVGSQWWVKMEDDVSREPDELIVVVGHCHNRQNKAHVMVRYLRLRSATGNVITGLRKAKDMLRAQDGAISAHPVI